MKLALLLFFIFALTPFATIANADDAKPVKADNSALNARDANPNNFNQDKLAATADHQAQGSKQDVEVTRQIRAELVKTDGLSVYAKNIKIITKDNRVILRGPVHSDDERMKVASVAKKYAGKNEIENDLEVK